MNIKNKKVLVTGADGFIGSHLVEGLLAEGAKVRAFCYYNSFNSWGWLDTLDKAGLSKIDVFMGDVRDPHGVREAMKGIDVIFHLAALIGIPYSYHSPAAYVDTNINGTLNILQAAREFALDKVLVTSTSEVKRLVGSMAKIRALTGWKPEYTLDKGLDETIKWLKDKDNLKIYKSGIYNV